MTGDMKPSFDAAIAEMLNHSMNSSESLKFSKKWIKIFSSKNKNHGKISFDYLPGQKAYYFSMTAWSPEFSDFLKEIDPPYSSNVPAGFDHHFFMSTIMENRGVYSRSDGKIILPKNEDDLNKIISHIGSCLNDFYIPWMENFTGFSVGLIDKILNNPEFYSYPVPLIEYICRENFISFESMGVQLRKGVVKNKKYDEELLGIS